MITKNGSDIFWNLNYDFGVITPRSIRSGISTANHGPSPSEKACATPNLGTFLKIIKNKIERYKHFYFITLPKVA